jgi:LysR family transcriptional regulator, low CO2-responsive transcriptional regulator
MKHATLRQLKVFETVARRMSFSRAADELHLTQPAVSIQVKTLEQHAGVALFEQLGKKIFLTPAGTELLYLSRTIIQKFQEAEEAMSQFKGVAGGQLNVAVISAGDYFFPRLLVEFAHRHANVSFNFAVYNRQELLVELAENRTDLAIMVRPPDALEADTVNVPFAPHPYVIVAASDHPLVREKALTQADVLREPFIVREVGSDTRKSMEEGLAGHFHELKIAMEIKSTETIKQAVIAGMGISFLSAHTIGREIQAGSLAVLNVLGFPRMLNWYVVHRREKRLPPVAEAFKRFLIADGAALIEQIVGFNPKPAKPARKR